MIQRICDFDGCKDLAIGQVEIKLDRAIPNAVIEGCMRHMAALSDRIHSFGIKHDAMLRVREGLQKLSDQIGVPE